MPILYWIILGGVFLALELFVIPIFYVMYFGISAWVVALLLALGVELSDPWQWMIFGVLGVVLLLSTRHMFKGSLKGNVVKPGEEGPNDYSYVADNETATILESFEHGHGVVEWRGVRWKALLQDDQNHDDGDLPIGGIVAVIQQKNLTLLVAPVGVA